MIEKSNNIHELDINMKQSECHYVLNISDVHFDSKGCDRKLLKKHLDLALERNATVFINGDLLDVMGCKRDPRSVPNEIRPEYNKAGGSYLDLVVEDCFSFFEKYKDIHFIISYGNHETNIVKRMQHDPLKQLQLLMNSTGGDVVLGAYQGAIVMRFHRGKSSEKRLIKWFYHHGSGGGARRSKGILNADILVSQNSWADIITSGHDHNKWHFPFTAKHLSPFKSEWGKRKIDILRTGSYKKKPLDFGWSVEKDFNEPTLGGWWVKNKWENTSRNERVIKTTIEEAN